MSTIDPFIKELRFANLLSFGPDTVALPLRALNVLIGPNGSGKSNLIEAISLLRSAPGDMPATVRDGGGIRDWLWKGSKTPTAHLEAVIRYSKRKQGLRHWIDFTEGAGRMEIVGEQIEDEAPATRTPFEYYKNSIGLAAIRASNRVSRKLKRIDIDSERSILAQRKDPDEYPEVTYVGNEYSRIRLYREWSFGRYTPPRLPQKDTGSSLFLDENCANLGLILNSLMGEPEVKSVLLKRLRDLYAGVDDIHTEIQAGHVQVVLHEGRMKIPATRLSDGTLRYLCLLAILCHPNMPPLVCIEEPELGLHPDAVVAVAGLLKEASQRSQLVVTTHSQVIVDALSSSPEDIVVCEKVDGCTRMNRLDGDALKVWLEKYSLGNLWRSGELGGNRW